MAAGRAAINTGLSLSDLFDVAVIGGGVIGCAVARRFTLEGARVILLEGGPDILSGASKGNSALLHTGFDAPSGSLEQACIVRGYAEYCHIRQRLNLPLLETGALVIAWNDTEQAALAAILQQAQSNGISDARLINRTELLRDEPALSDQAQAAIRIPGEHVIDPWSAPLAYLRQALANGAQAVFGSSVTAGDFNSKRWHLTTSQGTTVQACFVINCGGLFGDHLDQALLGESAFEIRPRKGQFLVFDKPASSLFRSILLPVPTEHSKGIVVCRTVFGNVLVGPTAEEQTSRDCAAVDSATLDNLYATAIRIIPALAQVPVTASYAGLRPATALKDYRILPRADQHWISIGGIRSTGLTAALGIARYSYDLYRQMGFDHPPIAAPQIKWPQVPNLAEHGVRDWMTPGYGEIVCHCELVTEREIRAALDGPLPACDLAGLKRRTRVTMGRCQGFYCFAQLAKLTEGRLRQPLTVAAAHG